MLFLPPGRLAGPRLDPAAQALCRFPSKVPYLWLGDAGGMLPAPLQANIYSEQMLHGFIRLAQKMQGRNLDCRLPASLTPGRVDGH